MLPALLIPVAASEAQRAAFPGAAWPTATPAAVGLNAKVLDSLDAEIREGRYGNVDRVLVIRRGRVAFDRKYRHDYDRIYGDSAKVRSPLNAHDVTGPYNYYAAWWHPYYRRGDLHTLQSVTKTITSVVIGTAVTRGEFPSLDTPVLQFFDTVGVANIDDRKRRMTIRHLLTMTDGMDWNEALPYTDPRNTTVAMEGSKDWIRFTLDQPMAREPGESWRYNSGASQLLAQIVHRATGLDIEEYAARHLFGPLGIRNWYWKRTPTGLVDTEGGLYLEAGDLARIWYLFLQNGMWNGTRVLDPAWVQESVKPHVATNANPAAPRYGFKWWLYPNPRDASRYVWGGSGFGGQFPLAIPEDDLVIVLNGWNILPGRPSLPMRRALERILNGVTDRRP